MTCPANSADAPRPDGPSGLRPCCVGVGAGGHAKVVIESLQRAGRYEVFGLLDAARERSGSSVLGITILGGDEKLQQLRAAGIHHAFIGVGTARNTQARVSIWNHLQDLSFDVISVIDPFALVSPSARIGRGVTIMPRATIMADARLGENVLINTGAIVEHDCCIGDHVHVATGAVLAGSVVVEEEAFIAAGACIRPGIRIGKAATVGAGAMVVRDVPAGAVVTGVPARPHGTEERSWTIRHAS